MQYAEILGLVLPCIRDDATTVNVLLTCKYIYNLRHTAVFVEPRAYDHVKHLPLLNQMSHINYSVYIANSGVAIPSCVTHLYVYCVMSISEGWIPGKVRYVKFYTNFAYSAVNIFPPSVTHLSLKPYLTVISGVYTPHITHLKLGGEYGKHPQNNLSEIPDTVTYLKLNTVIEHRNRMVCPKGVKHLVLGKKFDGIHKIKNINVDTLTILFNIASFRFNGNGCILGQNSRFTSFRTPNIKCLDLPNCYPLGRKLVNIPEGIEVRFKKYKEITKRGAYYP